MGNLAWQELPRCNACLTNAPDLDAAHVYTDRAVTVQLGAVQGLGWCTCGRNGQLWAHLRFMRPRRGYKSHLMLFQVYTGFEGSVPASKYGFLRAFIGPNAVRCLAGRTEACWSSDRGPGPTPAHLRPGSGNLSEMCKKKTRQKKTN